MLKGLQNQDLNHLIEKFGKTEAEEINKQVTKASQRTGIYSTAIIRLKPHDWKHDIGSGTFVIIAGEKGILTNWHVAELFIEANASHIVVPCSETESKKLAFKSIIKLPPYKGSSYPDFAFIVLKDSDSVEWDGIMSSLRKQFFNMDEAKIRSDRERSLYQEQGVLWLIHGSVAEGRKQINNRTAVYYKKAGPYIAVPDLDHIEKVKYDYPQLGTIEVDLIDCAISVEDRNRLPKFFGGMSGAALWNVIFNSDKEIENIELVGVATIQNTESDKLICQGPIALYETFYPHVMKYVNL